MTHRKAIDRNPDPELEADDELMERATRAWEELRADVSINPLDALAMVVWPPSEAERRAAGYEKEPA